MYIWYMHACMLVNTAMQMNCTVCYAAYQLECRLGRQTFCFPTKLAVNDGSIHAHANFSAGLYHPEQYSVSQR